MIRNKKYFQKVIFVKTLEKTQNLEVININCNTMVSPHSSSIRKFLVPKRAFNVNSVLLIANSFIREQISCIMQLAIVYYISIPCYIDLYKI